MTTGEKQKFERGIRLYKARAYKRALEEFKSLDLNFEKHPEAAYYTGLCHVQLEEWEKALFYLEQVVGADISFLHNYQCRMVLGYIYSVTGRYRLAEYEFKRTLEEGSESVQAFSSLGFTVYAQGRVDESIEYFQKALALNPDSPTALNSLGYILAEEDVDIPRALVLCKKAVGLRPGNSSYLDSLGWASYKAGKLADARSFLRKALEIQPGNKEIAGHLKTVLSCLKEKK